MTVRSAYLGTAHTARTLIAAREVAQRWNEPSALAEMTTGEVAGHLARAVFTVQQYLDGPVPDGAPTIDAAAYFVEAAKVNADLDGELNRSIRTRAHAEAEAGHGALLTRLDDAIEQTTAQLSEAPADRALAVIAGIVIALDDYLVTRLVELAVHIDDLAVSIDMATPELARDARDLVLGCLLDMARHARGDLTVMRAMARRERASADVLRVL